MVVRSELHRLSDTLWSYIPSHGERIPPDEFEEIRLSVPRLENGRERFELVKAIRRTFENNRERLKRDFFGDGFRVDINDRASPIAGVWDVGFKREACLSKRLLRRGLRGVKQFFPFFRTLTKRRVAVISVHPAKECVPSRLARATKRIITLQAAQWNQPKVLKLHLPAIDTPQQAIQKESFQDSFTTIAAKALETVCPHFVLETAHRDGYRFIMVNNELSLEVIDGIVDGNEERYRDENREVVRAYRNFLMREFGPDIVDYISLEYKIDFEKMIENGDPLFPDHVAKCNIGANNIEMHHIEALWEWIKQLPPRLRAHPNQAQPAEAFLSGLEGGLNPPLRVLRNILKILSQKKEHPTVADLLECIEKISGRNPCPSVQSLSFNSFNAIVSMIMPSDEERERSFTGRKIRHLAVMGYNTMGDPNIPCRCRELFELLHIFGDLRKDNWKNFFELLAHVVSKKSVYRENRVHDENEQTVRTGLLIPGPNVEGKTRRWYYVDGFYDDSEGNVNYVLLPACKEDAKTAPMVKLYRSTASNRNAENSYDSIMADLNPRGPGSLRPDLSLRYGKEQFFERSIPVWMGYLLSSTKDPKSSHPEGDTEAAKRIAFLKKSFDNFKEYMAQLHPEESIEEITALREHGEFDQLRTKLYEYGEKFRERKEDKIGQDIACVGHSLGGALAQQGTYDLTVTYGRMPLSNHQFICYSSDGPATTNEQDRKFMEFGRSHRKMFLEQKVTWMVCHQFEAGDIVPESGGSHLGTTEHSPEKDDWLKEHVGVFAPRDGATALSIVTPATHGRRIGTAVNTKDYSFSVVTPGELATYDHSFYLPSKLRKIWKYRLLNSPKLAERVRSTVGHVLQQVGVLRVLDNLGGGGVGRRDADGVLAVRYAPLV